MLYLHGIGHFHPENVISNDFLESLDIGTTDSWIAERVGIRTRRTVLPLDYIRETRNRDVRGAHEAALYSNAETGKRAAEMAIARAGIKAEQIGMVIAGGCGADYAIPAEASRIAALLGVEATAFDLSSACASFGVQAHFVASMRPEALPDYVLIVQPENTTKVVDYGDRSTAVLWGDGSAAAVFSPRLPARAVIDTTSVGSAPNGWAKVVIPRLGHFAQDGRAVQTFAIKTTRRLVSAVMQEAGLTPDRVKLIGHQANLLMLQAVLRHCGIAPENHYFNVDEFGNTGAAGAPTVLSQRWDTFADGDTVVMAVVGSGLTWSGLRVSFGAPP